MFAEDEARIGQQGTLTRVWARTGSRPTAIKQTEYQWVYLWAAMEPLTGVSVAMVTPTVDTGLMNQFLLGLSGMLGPQEQGILVLDNAGWHVAKALQVPANLTLMPLPPYAPELNPAERLWGYLRRHSLSNRVYADYDDLLEQTTRAYDQLDSSTVKSVCACSWMQRALQA